MDRWQFLESAWQVWHFTAYLTWLEIYVIHAICPFCVASAVIISLIFILAIIRLFKQPALLGGINAPHPLPLH